MKIIVIIFFCLFLFSCNTKKDEMQNLVITVNKDSLQNVLINIDKSWSDSAQIKGFNKSRLDFAADNAINMLDKGMPLIGKNAISDFASSRSDSLFSIQWKALKAEVSDLGDMGYTFGSWELKTKTSKGNDTIIYGDYLTVWKKQLDNSWKYVIDGGNETPKEVKL